MGSGGLVRDEAARLFITGMGAVSPNGVGVGDFARSLRAGRSGVGLLGFEGSDEAVMLQGACVSTVAARCVGFDPLDILSRGELARVPAAVPMGIAAAREAMAMAGLAVGSDLAPEIAATAALVLGTGGGGIDFTLDQLRAMHRGDRPSLWTITNATHGNLAGELSIALGLHGPSLCVSTGCASSSDAVGLAMDMLRSDRPGSPDRAVVVGADAHVRPEVLRAMEMLRVISTRRWGDAGEAATASRPFDATRDGFVLGEGAWAVVIERADAMERREGEPIAEMLGYGSTCDAFHRVRPAPDMRESARAMGDAITDAGLTADEIEVVHYHGTATALNDELETVAVKLALGDHARRVAGSSIKGMIGHPQGACGLASVVATVASLTGADGGEAFIPPTINLREPDPACDLDYTPNVAVATGARTALVNCLAFGAKNSALVVRVV